MIQTARGTVRFRTLLHGTMRYHAYLHFRIEHMTKYSGAHTATGTVRFHKKQFTLRRNRTCL